MTHATSIDTSVISLPLKRDTDSLEARKIRLTANEKSALAQLAREKDTSIRELIESSIGDLLVKLDRDESPVVLMPPHGAPLTSVKVRNSVLDQIRKVMERDDQAGAAFSISDLIAAAICACLAKNESTEHVVDRGRPALQIIRTAA